MSKRQKCVRGRKKSAYDIDVEDARRCAYGIFAAGKQRRCPKHLEYACGIGAPNSIFRQ